MPTEDWAADVIAHARVAFPSVTEKVGERILKLLTGSASERALTSSELTAISSGLLADMSPPKGPEHGAA